MEKDNTETRTREIVTDVLAAQPCRLSVPLRTQVKLSMTTATCSPVQDQEVERVLPLELTG